MDEFVITAIRLILAHIIGDFYLQTSKMAEGKANRGFRSLDLFLHSVVLGLLSWILLFNWSLWWVFPLVFLIHFCVDGFKAMFKDSAILFFIDQIIHLLTLLFVAYLIADRNEYTVLPVRPELYLLGFLVVGRPAAFAVRKIVLGVFGSESLAGTPNAGFTIGIIERCLILVFVIINQYTAIGFLVAAKSVYRFSDTQKDQQKLSEYLLLGTLLSFSFAIFTGLTIKLISKC